jgi:leucyl aminopeptidase
LKESEVTHINGSNKTVFLTAEKASTTTITGNATIRVSPISAHGHNYLGNVSDLLSSAYFFSRTQHYHAPSVISVESTVPEIQHLINLSKGRNQTREWGNGRGDIQGVPQYFRAISERIAHEHKLELTVVAGDDLLTQGFRLIHAVGRASINKPVFVNIAYHGNPNSTEWTSYVGKGVCFDTGGLNIKTGKSLIILSCWNVRHVYG